MTENKVPQSTTSSCSPEPVEITKLMGDLGAVFAHTLSENLPLAPGRCLDLATALVVEARKVLVDNTCGVITELYNGTNPLEYKEKVAFVVPITNMGIKGTDRVC